MIINEFDWDQNNTKKCQKHGLAIAEIENFLSSNPKVAADQKHSQTESRFIAFGSHSKNLLFVAFAIRAIDFKLKLRVISARRGRKKELRRFYGEFQEKER